jgi:metallophosphoesterase (TIGR00282 family)
MRLLFIGDVFGTLGQEALKTYLPQLKQELKPHLIVVNAENIDRGFGIDEAIYKELMGMGIAMITMGNHTFRNKKIFQIIDDANILRPANYDESVPGTGIKTIRYNAQTVTIISLMGRVFMGDPLDNPFKVVDQLLEDVSSDYVFIDFHAEATSEKLAFAHYVDGRVTAVVGTHTHVPTADAMVLPKGTMYITDLGMTGPLHGILGAERDAQIHKFRTGMRGPVVEATTGPKQLNGVLIDTATHTIRPIHIREDQPSTRTIW